MYPMYRMYRERVIRYSLLYRFQRYISFLDTSILCCIGPRYIRYIRPRVWTEPHLDTSFSIHRFGDTAAIHDTAIQRDTSYLMYRHPSGLVIRAGERMRTTALPSLTVCVCACGLSVHALYTCLSYLEAARMGLVPWAHPAGALGGPLTPGHGAPLCSNQSTIATTSHEHLFACVHISRHAAVTTTATTISKHVATQVAQKLLVTS